MVLRPCRTPVPGIKVDFKYAKNLARLRSLVGMGWSGIQGDCSH